MIVKVILNLAVNLPKLTIITINGKHTAKGKYIYDEFSIFLDKKMDCCGGRGGPLVLLWWLTSVQRVYFFTVCHNRRLPR